MKVTYRQLLFTVLTLGVLFFIAVTAIYHSASFSVNKEAFERSAELRDRKEQGNQFQIGQVVYIDDNYYFAQDLPKAERNERIAVVLDMTEELLRVQFIDGHVAILNYAYFIPATLTDEWLLGNPFRIGDEVCAIPSSVRETFPDRGFVVEMTHDILVLEGFPQPIAWGHFQNCVD